jgi:hypothetical protein
MEHLCFPLGPGVRAHSAVDAMFFFKKSPFYDESCNNEDPRIPANDLGRDQLQMMTGVEYDVDDDASAPPGLWVINHQARSSPTAVERLNVFYLINDQILQAPRASQLVDSRLSNVNHHLRVALEALAAVKPIAGADTSDGAIAFDSAAATSGPDGILADPATAAALRAAGLGQGQGWGDEAMRIMTNDVAALAAAQQEA